MRPTAPLPEALRTLEGHDWPGNARQLRNLLERILFLQNEDIIRLGYPPAEIRGGADGSPPPSGAFFLPSDGVDLEAVEQDLIRQALEQCGGNKSQAARLLGLTRDTLRYRVEKYRMEGWLRRLRSEAGSP